MIGRVQRSGVACARFSHTNEKRASERTTPMVVTFEQGPPARLCGPSPGLSGDRGAKRIDALTRYIGFESECARTSFFRRVVGIFAQEVRLLGGGCAARCDCGPIGAEFATVALGAGYCDPGAISSTTSTGPPAEHQTRSSAKLQRLNKRRISYNSLGPSLR